MNQDYIISLIADRARRRSVRTLAMQAYLCTPEQQRGVVKLPRGLTGGAENILTVDVSRAARGSTQSGSYFARFVPTTKSK